jgi:hypothetical protein
MRFVIVKSLRFVDRSVNLCDGIKQKNLNILLSILSPSKHHS